MNLRRRDVCPMCNQSHAEIERLQQEVINVRSEKIIEGMKEMNFELIDRVKKYGEALKMVADALSFPSPNVELIERIAREALKGE